MKEVPSADESAKPVRVKLPSHNMPGSVAVKMVARFARSKNFQIKNNNLSIS